MTVTDAIRPKHREAILQSLRAGVVPRMGHQHIQVGRANEVRALLQDLVNIADGGAGVRFIIGPYGSGKTFFLFLVRAMALDKNLVAVQADLNPDRRLQASGGQARSLYNELLRNVATRSKPDGGALSSIVEKFVSTALGEARTRGVDAEAIIRERLAALSELVGGYDFAEVIAAYWRGYDTANEELKAASLRWLRGEFSTRTDARAALGVRSIVDDNNVYDQLKLLSRFVRIAGYAGLLVCLDEMVNIYKLASAQARNSNYEQILRIVNDTLQGSSEGLGFLFGGTPEFLFDTRRGVYSYAALQSRLAENRFAADGLVDYGGPVLRLSNLTREDLYVLLRNVRNVYASGNPEAYLVPDEGLEAFMLHCSDKIGDSYFQTPRNTIREFVGLLAVLEQNPNASWREILGSVEIAADREGDLVIPDGPDDIDDELTSARI